MPALSGIYDSAPIQPLAKIGENISLLSARKWVHLRVDFEEPVPPGPDTTVDMLTVAGVNTLAANATLAQRVVPALQLSSNEFMQVRFEPVDNVELALWELAGQQRFATANIHARLDRRSRAYDPDASLSTFGVWGQNRDAQMAVRNPLGAAIFIARFIYYGFRYIVTEHKPSDEDIRAKLYGGRAVTANQLSDARTKLADGDLNVTKLLIGPTVWFPVEGRSS